MCHWHRNSGHSLTREPDAEGNEQDQRTKAVKRAVSHRPEVTPTVAGFKPRFVGVPAHDLVFRSGNVDINRRFDRTLTRDTVRHGVATTVPASARPRKTMRITLVLGVILLKATYGYAASMMIVLQHQ